MYEVDYVMPSPLCWAGPRERWLKEAGRAPYPCVCEHLHTDNAGKRQHPLPSIVTELMNTSTKSLCAYLKAFSIKMYSNLSVLPSQGFNEVLAILQCTFTSRVDAVCVRLALVPFFR